MENFKDYVIRAAEFLYGDHMAVTFSIEFKFSKFQQDMCSLFTAKISFSDSRTFITHGTYLKSLDLNIIAEKFGITVEHEKRGKLDYKLLDIVVEQMMRLLEKSE